MQNLTLSSIDPYKLFYCFIKILAIHTFHKVYTQLLNRLLQCKKKTNNNNKEKGPYFPVETETKSNVQKYLAFCYVKYKPHIPK